MEPKEKEMDFIYKGHRLVAYRYKTGWVDAFIGIPDVMHYFKDGIPKNMLLPIRTNCVDIGILEANKITDVEKPTRWINVEWAGDKMSTFKADMMRVVDMLAEEDLFY